MRAAPVDLNPPPPPSRPFFWGSFANTALPAATWTNLPITTVTASQRGMQLSGGGCKVPIPGLYSIGAMWRSDQGTATMAYHHMQIAVNGGVIGYSINNNGNVGGNIYPYAYSQLWLPQPLNAGDIVTVLGYCNTGTLTVYGAAGWSGAGLRVLYECPWTGAP